MKVLVDTGVLLRVFDRAAPQQSITFRALRKLWSDGHELVTTAQKQHGHNVARTRAHVERIGGAVTDVTSLHRAKRSPFALPT
jgi:hypothetical protein